MKVLDPQAALLPIGEVHQFLKSSSLRPVDPKLGAYQPVNLHNYRAVRHDLETYIQATAPYVQKQRPSETWMKDLLSKLKKYNLTKTEVFALINLGIGLNEAQPATKSAKSQHETNGDNDVKEEEDIEEEDEEVEESGLNRMLFGLVVEEAEERFPGDEGEEQISHVLQILKETIVENCTKSNGTVANES